MKKRIKVGIAAVGVLALATAVCLSHQEPQSAGICAESRAETIVENNDQNDDGLAMPHASTDAEAPDIRTPAENAPFGPEVSAHAGEEGGTRLTPGGNVYPADEVEGMSPEEIAAFEENVDKALRHDAQNALLESDPTAEELYCNRELRLELPDGGVLKIGCNCNETDAIYLNPVYEPTEEGYVFSEEHTAFAFYLCPVRCGGITFWSDERMSFDITQEHEIRRFVISERTYDTLIPSDYIDQIRFGVKWKDENNFHGFDGSDCDIRIRCVRLPDGELTALANLHISFDPVSCKYTPESLTLTDVVSTEELTEEKRRDVIEKAFEFFASDEKGQSNQLNEADWETYRNKACVEKVRDFYFSSFFDEHGNVAHAAQFCGMDMYAVNITYPGFGFFTVYAAPERQLSGLRESVPSDENLQPFAYDAVMPFSKSKLFVPEYQKEDFFHDSAER